VPSLVAFNVLPGRVVSYPSTLALPLAVAMAVLLAVLLVVCIWRRRLRIAGLFLGVVHFVVSLVAGRAREWKLVSQLQHIPVLHGAFKSY